MRQTLRHILPGLGLILAASVLLLLSDLGSRNRDAPVRTQAFTHAHPAKIAILQPASNPVMDDTCKGYIDGLAQRGYKEGDNLVVTNLNAQNDQSTIKLMAQQIASGNYDLGASISTLCLQALATSNQKGRLPEIFCAVSDPVAAGVGIKSMDSLDKPAYLTGYGSAQPVEAIFREAVAANPKLKVVGVVWNTAEINSEVCTKRARAICQELGLTLLEAPIDNASNVREAADSLVARGIEAFWTGGDATVISAYDVLQNAADKAHIPIFSNISGQAKKGALFDLGANYYQVGLAGGQLAADILDGRAPASIPVRDMMPTRIGLNEKTRAAIRDTWTFTASQYDRAGYIVERSGDVREVKPVTAVAPTPATAGPDTRPILPPPTGKLPWRAQVMEYMETVPSEETFAGLKDGLKQSGLVEGRDIVLRQRCAQGDMTMINSLFDSAASDGTDLYVIFSTPTLQTAVRKVSQQPVVFTFVTDPLAAGAGESDQKHLPNFTGISTRAPAKEMVALLKEYFPTWKKIGTLYCPAEINSVANLKFLTDIAAAAGIEVVPMAANTVGDLPDAALALTGKDIDAVVQISDNQSAAGFGAIARACRTRHLPLFCFQSSMIEQGAILAVSMDYHQAGVDTAAKIAQVLRGDNPGSIPFTRPSKQLLVVNLSNARAVGITLPPALVQKADKVDQ